MLKRMNHRDPLAPLELVLVTEYLSIKDFTKATRAAIREVQHALQVQQQPPPQEGEQREEPEPHPENEQHAQPVNWAYDPYHNKEEEDRERADSSSSSTSSMSSSDSEPDIEDADATEDVIPERVQKHPIQTTNLRKYFRHIEKSMKTSKFSQQRDNYELESLRSYGKVF